MAWSEFYMDAGGSNLNAGSVVNAAASITSTNGNWSTTTNIFTPAGGGTPFSAVTAGEWVSIYNDGASITTFIGQVATVNSGGATLTIHATNRLGTVPTTSATARTLKVGGSWVSFAICTTSVFTAGTAGVPMRINVQAGTYANTTTSRTQAASGAATAPIWWRGYKTTPGDMDARPVAALVAGTDIPLVTFTTAAFTASGTFTNFSALAFSASANTQAVFTLNAASLRAVRCRFISTNAAAGAYGYRQAVSGSGIVACYVSATTTATSAVRLDTANGVVIGCRIVGGAANIELNNASHMIVGNLLTGAATYGISGIASSTVAHLIVGNTIDGPGTDGIRFSVATNQAVILNNIVTNCAGVGINNSSGTDNPRFTRGGNLFFNNGANYAGMGDDAAFEDQTDSGTPYTTPGSDYTPLITSNAVGKAIPGIFENTTHRTYTDIGAVDIEAPTDAAIADAVWTYGNRTLT